MASDRSDLSVKASAVLVVEPRYFFWGASLLLVGTILLLAPLPSISLAKRVEAYSFDRLAKRFPPASQEAARYRAVAEAIRSGQTNYQYITNSSVGPGR